MDNINQDPIDCWLLTGATGLVGRYVLAELMRAGRSVVVIVRKSPIASPAARIEEALATFEESTRLGRPKILSGDLTQRGLGLSEEDAQWLQGKRLGVIHSAASIRFQADSPQSEPYLSNIQGTENLLQLLKSCQVTSFLYVSSAYVTSRATVDAVPLFDGRRTEIAIEGKAEGGNDYESSKIAAEQMIRECDWIGKRTICRPSIIVGDSQTGYSSTFHGFYAPLKIGTQFTKSFGFSEEAGNWLRGQLGLLESDSKNFVPVDWVARAIVRVALNAALHGSIYHLTNPQPTTCGDIQLAIICALKKSSVKGDFPEVAPSTDRFRELLGAYESYFNSDPVFDCSHTLRAIPDLACPKVDAALLEKLADYAIRANFGWPRPSAQIPEYAKIIESLARLKGTEFVDGSEVLQLKLLGPAAISLIQFTRLPSGWQPLNDLARGAHADYRITVNSEDFAACIIGTNAISDLIASGRAVIQGNPHGVRLVFLNAWVQDLKLMLRLPKENETA